VDSQIFQCGEQPDLSGDAGAGGGFVEDVPAHITGTFSCVSDCPASTDRAPTAIRFRRFSASACFRRSAQAAVAAAALDESVFCCTLPS
jgi:hypothetical protein